MKRKSKAEPEKTPDVAQSMKQAEAFWGISGAVLRVAKAAGCPAFIQHRIHRDPLIKWLEENPDAPEKGKPFTDAAELKRQKTEAEVTLLKAKIARENRETIPLDLARSEWSRAMAIMIEEAKNLMERDHFRVYCERTKSKVGEVLA